MDKNIKGFFRVILFPVLYFRKEYHKKRIEWIAVHNPRKLASMKYEYKMHKQLDWENPRDLNEKINWLKFNIDTSEWTRLSDKYRVREYIRERGREDLLVKLYGVWDDVDSIDFDSLPDRFVLKSNNGCGTVILVENKRKLNVIETKKTLKKWLKKSFGVLSAEPHYTAIKPLIIAEEYLNNDQTNSSSLVDYKVWCFDGEPYCIMVCANRIIGKGVELAVYDLNWCRKQEMLAGSHALNDIQIEKPKCLEELLKAAKQLSCGHPEVRVDFYIVNDKIYFGEMTFTSLGGYMDYFAPKYLLEMGALITLPKC